LSMPMSLRSPSVREISRQGDVSKEELLAVILARYVASGTRADAWACFSL